MSRPVLLQDDFSLGQRPDDPREQIPKGAVFALTDYLPKASAPLQKRGGWARPWNAIPGIAPYAMGFCPFSTGSKIVTINNVNTLSSMAIGSPTVTNIGAVSNFPAEVPTFYRNKLYVCSAYGNFMPSVFDGTAITTMAASTPYGTLSCVYKDHLVLARSETNTSRVWFANGGDPTTWNTGANGQWLDMSHPAQALAALRNMIIVFGEGFTERIRGDIIPGISGSDMVREPLFSVGCSDPASVAVDGDYCVFANSTGIYLTDGSGVADLTEQGGNKRLWQQLLAGYSSIWTIAGCIFRGVYHCSVLQGGVFICAFAVDIKRRVFTRLSNLATMMMVSTPVGILDAPAGFFMGERLSPYVADLTTMYTGAGNGVYKADGNGTAVLPSVELPHYIGKPGVKRWRNAYVKGLLTDAATDNPTLSLGFSTDPASTAYTTASKAFTETTQTGLQRIPLSAQTFGGTRGEGLSLKLTQTAASADTRINSILADVSAEEPSKL